MNFLSIEKPWTENETVFMIIEFICYTSSLEISQISIATITHIIKKMSIITDVVFDYENI